MSDSISEHNDSKALNRKESPNHNNNYTLEETTTTKNANESLHKSASINSRKRPIKEEDEKEQKKKSQKEPEETYEEYLVRFVTNKKTQQRRYSIFPEDLDINKIRSGIVAMKSQQKKKQKPVPLKIYKENLGAKSQRKIYLPSIHKALNSNITKSTDCGDKKNSQSVDKKRHRNSIFEMTDDERKEFLSKIKSRYVNEMAIKLNKLYGIDSVFNKKKRSLRKYKKEDRVSLEKYQDKIMQVNQYNLCDDNMNGLYKRLKHLRVNTEDAKPLPPINFTALIHYSFEQEREKKKKNYEKPWLGTRKTEPSNDYERELEKVTKLKHSLKNSRKEDLAMYKILDILPIHLKEALLKNKVH